MLLDAQKSENFQLHQALNELKEEVNILRSTASESMSSINELQQKLVRTESELALKADERKAELESTIDREIQDILQQMKSATEKLISVKTINIAPVHSALLDSVIAITKALQGSLYR